MDYSYVLLNVFTVPGERLSGNALCVFEDARGLETAQMQALARQFNLSETTFILPASSAEAHARVRIFTPDIEMPFAGHPILGTAHVVRARAAAGPIVLEMSSGLVAVLAQDNRWTLRAPRVPIASAPYASCDALAAMLGLAAGRVLDASWIDTGVKQLIIRVHNTIDVRAARPVAALFQLHGQLDDSKIAMGYVFTTTSATEIEARFFFQEASAIVEDPATGSACANLGGYWLARGAALPFSYRINQGAQVSRPSELTLRVEAPDAIYVSGSVVELGRGTISV